MPQTTEFQKNLIGWIGIFLTVLASILYTSNKIETNALRIERNEAAIKELEKDKAEMFKLLTDIRLEMIKGLSDIKLELAGKADSEHKN